MVDAGPEPTYEEEMRVPPGESCGHLFYLWQTHDIFVLIAYVKKLHLTAHADIGTDFWSSHLHRTFFCMWTTKSKRI